MLNVLFYIYKNILPKSKSVIYEIRYNHSFYDNFFKFFLLKANFFFFCNSRAKYDETILNTETLNWITLLSIDQKNIPLNTFSVHIKFYFKYKMITISFPVVIHTVTHIFRYHHFIKCLFPIFPFSSLYGLSCLCTTPAF